MHEVLRTLTVCAVALPAALIGQASAQDYPTRPGRVIVVPAGRPDRHPGASHGAVVGEPVAKGTATQIVPSAQYAEFVAAETEKFAKAVKLSGAKIE